MGMTPQDSWEVSIAICNGVASWAQGLGFAGLWRVAAGQSTGQGKAPGGQVCCQKPLTLPGT